MNQADQWRRFETVVSVGVCVDGGLGEVGVVAGLVGTLGRRRLIESSRGGTLANGNFWASALTLDVVVASSTIQVAVCLSIHTYSTPVNNSKPPTSSLVFVDLSLTPPDPVPLDQPPATNTHRLRPTVHHRRLFCALAACR